MRGGSTVQSMTMCTYRKHTESPKPVTQSPWTEGSWSQPPQPLLQSCQWPSNRPPSSALPLGPLSMTRRILRNENQTPISFFLTPSKSPSHSERPPATGAWGRVCANATPLQAPPPSAVNDFRDQDSNMCTSGGLFRPWQGVSWGPPLRSVF